jgi:hypothetical protein
VAKLIEIVELKKPFSVDDNQAWCMPDFRTERLSFRRKRQQFKIIAFYLMN